MRSRRSCRLSNHVVVVAGLLVVLAGCGQGAFADGVDEVVPSPVRNEWSPAQTRSYATAACETEQKGASTEQNTDLMAAVVGTIRGEEFSREEAAEFVEYALDHCDELLADPQR